LISQAKDSDGDPIGVIEPGTTWEEPEMYSPIEYTNGALKITKKSPYKGIPSTEVIKAGNMEFDGIPTLRLIMRMYKKAVKKAGQDAYPQDNMDETSYEKEAVDPLRDYKEATESQDNTADLSTSRDLKEVATNEDFSKWRELDPEEKERIAKFVKDSGDRDEAKRKAERAERLAAQSARLAKHIAGDIDEADDDTSHPRGYEEATDAETEEDLYKEGKTLSELLK
jgi:hypothetical protein